MQVIQQIDVIRAEIRAAVCLGRRVGLVPTMGALHPGHASLVEIAKAECDLVAATIFVNPTQFGPKEDLSKYPRTLDADLKLLAQYGCDFVFTPAPEDLYRPTFSTYVEPPQVAKRWEGEFRPTHFRGVATVVLKLLQIVPAERAYFGMKDFQQLRVIEEMVHDLDLDVAIIRCPTVRERDGLAMSSRNRYLTDEERTKALAISRALKKADLAIRGGERSAETIEQSMQQVLLQGGIHSIDYARIVQSDTLEPMEVLGGDVVALIAVRLGKTRLIDNQFWKGI